MHAKLRKGPALLACLTLLGAGTADASETIAEEQDLTCDVCHADPETDQLTDRGCYFEYLRTLDGFDAVIERFGECSFCHIHEAGSENFTEEGTRFRWMMENMKGLKAWLDQNHPRPEKPRERAEEQDD